MDPPKEYESRLARWTERAQAYERTHIWTGNLRILFFVVLLGGAALFCRTWLSVSVGLLIIMIGLFVSGMIHCRPHLEEALSVIKAHKPLFVDKPLVSSLRDALEIFRQARENSVPIYSGSSLRFYPNLREMKAADSGRLKGAFSCGPCGMEPHHPDLFWYGIHPTEALYTIMGPGCKTVVCTATADMHVVPGIWQDGKKGTLCGIHTGPATYQVVLYGSKKALSEQLTGDYAPFVRQLVKFFQTGVVPVNPEETLEIYAFMEAAEESKRQGDSPVKISDIMRKNGGDAIPLSRSFLR